MTAPMRAAGNRAIRVLEVGPGTGIVTQSIVRHLPAAAQLDVVELQRDFVQLLEERFQAEDLFRDARDRAQIHHMSLQAFAELVRPADRDTGAPVAARSGDANPDDRVVAPAPYDFIISGLPLNNFDPGAIAEIFEIFRTLLKPGGTLSYFEYMYVRQVRRTISFGKRRQHIERLDRALIEPWRNNEYRRDRVWLNFPPAWVHHLRFDR
jgi:phosphatidylethanolamine/phosphatidyl-N-methylethanolamine N-methyltransferase